MKNMRTLLLFLTILLALNGTAAASNAVTTKNMLKLRKGPSKEDIPIFAYPKGEPVEVTGKSEDNRWYKVRVKSDGRTGFMWGEYISLGPDVSMRLDAAFLDVSNSVSSKANQPEEADTKHHQSTTVSVKLGGLGAEHQEYLQLQSKYDEAVRQVAARDAQIRSLQTEVSKLREDLVVSGQKTDALEKRLASAEKVRDVRLISMVEMAGEDIALIGVGTAQMASIGDWVVFKAGSAKEAGLKKVFGKTEHNTHIVGDVVYITTPLVNIETRKRGKK